MVGQAGTRIIRRVGNHEEEHGGEGLSLVSSPSKAIDVGLPLTLTSCRLWECGCWILQAVPHAHFYRLWACCWASSINHLIHLGVRFISPSVACRCHPAVLPLHPGVVSCGGGEVGGLPQRLGSETLEQSDDGSLPNYVSVTDEVSKGCVALVCDSVLTGFAIIHENPPRCAQLM